LKQLKDEEDVQLAALDEEFDQMKQEKLMSF